MSNGGKMESLLVLSLAGFPRNPFCFTPRVLQSENSFSGSQHPLDKRVIFPARVDP